MSRFSLRKINRRADVFNSSVAEFCKIYERRSLLWFLGPFATGAAATIYRQQPGSRIEFIKQTQTAGAKLGPNLKGYTPHFLTAEERVAISSRPAKGANQFDRDLATTELNCMETGLEREGQEFTRTGRRFTEATSRRRREGGSKLRGRIWRLGFKGREGLERALT
jgi:hypothetical protein